MNCIVAGAGTMLNPDAGRWATEPVCSAVRSWRGKSERHGVLCRSMGRGLISLSHRLPHQKRCVKPTRNNKDETQTRATTNHANPTAYIMAVPDHNTSPTNKETATGQHAARIGQGVVVEGFYMNGGFAREAVTRA